jgi:hypothetical protein
MTRYHLPIGVSARLLSAETQAVQLEKASRQTQDQIQTCQSGRLLKSVQARPNGNAHKNGWQP